MRGLYLAAWFLVGLTLGAFLAAPAMAETIPASLVPKYVMNYDTPEEACAAQNIPLSFGCGVSRSVVFEAGKYYCRSTYDSTHPYGGAGTVCHNAHMYVTQVLACPSSGGWTPSGTSDCTRPDCPSGTVRQSDGSCGLPPCPEGQNRGPTGTGECKSQCSATGSNGKETGEHYRSSSTDPGLICAEDGCSYKPTSCMGINSHYYCWLGRSAGQSCNTNARNPDGSEHLSPDEQAALKTTEDQRRCIGLGKCPITINGVVTCSQCGEFSENKTTTTTNPDGSTTVTNTTVNGTVNGGTVSSTTGTSTTTTPSGGGTPTTNSGTSTSTEPTASFCQDNPQSPICAGDQKTDCEKNPELVQCKELGNPEEVGDLPEQSIGPDSLSPITLAGSAVCPANIPLPKGLSFSWQATCDFASGLRPVILAMAWLTAGLILVGAFKDG